MSEKQDLFKNILSEYKDKIFRLCCAYVTLAEDRKDLYQDILMRIWKGLDSFRQQSSIGTWIYRISVNSSIDFIRKENRKRLTNVQIGIDDLQIADQSQDTEKDIILSEKLRFLYECMNRLSFLDKTLVTLYLEDLSYKEIADILGISENHVGVRLHRIKKQLNTYFKDFEE